MDEVEYNRCEWLDRQPDIYIDYHDKEWGVPIYDDGKLFAMLILESFHCGLSWLVILKKREHFYNAFDNFNIKKISKYDETKIAWLVENKNIVRHRGKIEATIQNSKVFLDIQKEFDSFSKYLWGFTDDKVIKNMDDNHLTKNPLSDNISKDLKKRGMKFVGSTTIYSYLQAVGIINDHELTCFRYNEV